MSASSLPQPATMTTGPRAAANNVRAPAVSFLIRSSSSAAHVQASTTPRLVRLGTSTRRCPDSTTETQSCGTRAPASDVTTHGHLHVPPLHTLARGHPRPHAPQLFPSVFVSTHRLPHNTCPAVQTHSLRRQDPFPQTAEQP